MTLGRWDTRVPWWSHGEMTRAFLLSVSRSPSDGIIRCVVTHHNTTMC